MGQEELGCFQFVETIRRNHLVERTLQGPFCTCPIIADDVDKNGLIKVDAVGCAATLINCEIFKLIPEPWFLTGETHTEDIYFCMKARECVKGFEVYVDTTVECGHMLPQPVLDSANRELLMKIHTLEGGLNQLWQPDVRVSLERPNPYTVEELDVVKLNKEKEDGKKH